MLPLRYSGRWRLASLILLLVVLLGAVMPAVWLWPDRDPLGNWIGGVDKMAHFASFAALTVWFSGQYRRRSYWRIAVGLFAFGLLIEIVQQGLSYRTAETWDLVADVTGILAGLMVAAVGLGGWSLRLESWLETRRA